MAIQYAGGTNRNDLYAGVVSKASAIANIGTTLVAAGWTSTQLKPFTVLRNITANPANNETVTLDGKVYTFKTVINNANNGEVLIGIDKATSLSNLRAAVTLASGSGTIYSSATTLNTNLTATILNSYSTQSSLNIEQKSLSGGPYTCSSTLGSGSFSNATTINTGYKFTSATTPQYLSCKVFFFDFQEANTKIRWVVSNVSESTVNINFDLSDYLFGDASDDIRVIANKYQCFVKINGVAGNTGGAFLGVGVPWVPNFLTGLVISNATNATPPVITTTTSHGYTTGDSVTIRNVGGNTAANVTNNTITVLSATTFSLDGIVGSGAYTSGGVCAKTGKQIAEAIWASGSSGSNNFIQSRLSASTLSHFTSLNGSTITGGNGTGCLGLSVSYNFSNILNDSLTWYDSSYLVTEPFLIWGTGAGAIGTINGQMWDSVFLRRSLDRDLTGTFDSHNWWNLTDSSNGGSGSEGVILHVVP